MGTGNIVGCKQTWPNEQKKCQSAPCRGNDFGGRTLVPEYRLKLVVVDVDNKKMTITAFKKNIGTAADKTIPRLNGGSMNSYIHDTFNYLLDNECKITYWLKTQEGGKQEPIFIGYERIYNGNNIIPAAVATLEAVDATADADSVPPPPHPPKRRLRDDPKFQEWQRRPDLTDEDEEMLMWMKEKKMTLTILGDEDLV